MLLCIRYRLLEEKGQQHGRLRTQSSYQHLFPNCDFPLSHGQQSRNVMDDSYQSRHWISD